MSFIDDFNRANAANLGANWTVASSVDFTIVSNEARCLNAPMMSFYNGTTWPNDHYSRVTIGSLVDTASDNGIGPAIRMAAAATTAYFAQCNTHEINLYVVNGGSYALLGTAGAVATGDVIELSATGTSITVKKNGSTVIGPVTDATLTTGRSGIWGSDGSNGPTINAWEGDATASGTVLAVTTAAATLAGQNVTLDAPIGVTNASIILTGQDVTLVAGGLLTLVVDQGTISLAGQDVGLLANQNFTLPVTQALLTLEGQELPFDLTVPWTEGALTLTGQDISLTAGGAISLVVDGNQIDLTGQDVILFLDEDFSLSVTAAAITLTGQDVTFVSGGNITLAVDSVNLTVTGMDVGVNPSITLSSTGSARRKRYRGVKRMLNYGR